ncbi:MAG: methyltransferase [Propionibacteriaceae bacterium]
MITPDFEAMYAADPDPWRVGSSFYETRKRELVLAALGRPTYAAAWDPSCGTGHLVHRLAARCRTVLATDASPAAVELTSASCAGLDNVTVRRVAVPTDPGEHPVAGFDLVVIAEFLYYLDPAGRAATLGLIHELAAAGAEVVAVHWRHQPHDGWRSGAEVQQEVLTTLGSLGWEPAVHVDDPDFVLDTMRRPGFADLGTELGSVGRHDG